MRRYQLIGIDLDGTLLNGRREVSARNRAAIARARELGVRVVVCTGRGLAECRHILSEIQQDEPVVVAGGSMVACPRSGRTLHRFGLEEQAVRRATRRLIDHEHPVMILKDPSVGYDYLMVVGERRLALDPVTEWWLASMDVRHRFAMSLDEDEHPGHTVRLGVCGLSSRLAGLMADIRTEMNEPGVGAVNLHHFGAVVAPEHARRLPDGESLHILEAFAPEATKWSGIRWLAERDGLDLGRVAVIGDEINDLSMMEGARAAGGLAVAMGNAKPQVKAVAQRETAGHDEDGVAVAVEAMLEGRW